VTAWACDEDRPIRLGVSSCLLGHAVRYDGGRGLFASQLIDTYPNLPVEDEGRLNDAKLRENFVERAFAYRRLRNLFRARWTNEQLVAFHAAHELQLIAHAPGAHRELSRLVASVAKRPRNEIRDRYQTDFMAALARQSQKS